MMKPCVHHRCTVALCALLGAACSNTDESAPATRGTPDAAAQGGATAMQVASDVDVATDNRPVSFDGLGDAAREGDTLSASITMRDIQPGEESHECVIVELPNEAPVWVGKMRGTLSGGSHHLIVERDSADTPLANTAYTCEPTTADDDTRLLIVQQRETTLSLPEGVAFRLEAHQRIFLQLHFINVGSAPLQITGKVELTPFAGDGTPKEALSIFAGPQQLSIPAGRETSVTYTLPPNPKGDVDRRVFALTSHTHRLGIRSTIERVASSAEGAPAAALLHESLDWAEPPLSVFDTPLEFATGEDALRLTCQYQNTTDRDVSFGTSAHDEMCFMWMYYYDE